MESGYLNEEILTALYQMGIFILALIAVPLGLTVYVALESIEREEDTEESESKDQLAS